MCTSASGSMETHTTEQVSTSTHEKHELVVWFLSSHVLSYVDGPVSFLCQNVVVAEGTLCSITCYIVSLTLVGQMIFEYGHYSYGHSLTPNMRLTSWSPMPFLVPQLGWPPMPSHSVHQSFSHNTESRPHHWTP